MQPNDSVCQSALCSLPMLNYYMRFCNTVLEQFWNLYNDWQIWATCLHQDLHETQQIYYEDLWNTSFDFLQTFCQLSTLLIGNKSIQVLLQNKHSEKVLKKKLVNLTMMIINLNNVWRSNVYKHFSFSFIVSNPATLQYHLLSWVVY